LLTVAQRHTQCWQQKRISTLLSVKLFKRMTKTPIGMRLIYGREGLCFVSAEIVSSLD